MSAETVHARDSMRAADPGASVWVAASAGTGKTTVLTNRVLALLLAGTAPERILCLTFTKAAAAEMANRVNKLLGEWATVPDQELAERLAALTGIAAKGDALERARRLFAQVVDAPGGLKIETIHAFCESLLRRFPLEAGVAPHFQVMDERSSDELMALAQNEILARAQGAGNAKLATALAEVTSRVGEDEFRQLMADLAQARGRIAEMLAQAGGLAHAAERIQRRLGLGPRDSVERILKAACKNEAFDGPGLRRAAATMLEGSKTDQERGQRIADWLADPATRVERWDDYVSVYLTDKGAERVDIATKKLCAAHPGLDAALRVEAAHLIAARARIKAATVANATTALLALSGAMLASYRGHKSHRALLDFDDLILETRNLLALRGADWVLYKLDQGLDHILIDEAQDTNPDQWRIVASLAEEFFAGLGAHEGVRTVFAVGDAKQSIYSFQGADPEAFAAMRGNFSTQVKAAAGTWRDIPLSLSFRASPALLDAVDGVFARPEAADGVAAPGQPIHHEPKRTGQAGLVELWPPARPHEARPVEPWALPIARESLDSPPARLAALIATRIARWIERREPLESRDRPIRAGDIMVLVRRRTMFVEELVRALKAKRVPVAGVDRMVLTEQIAVMDLMALARFLLMPDDDLTLATLLKSPLVGWDEKALFDLAHDRSGRSLWSELVRRASERPDFGAAHATLAALLAQVDYAPPYELFARILGSPGRPGETSGRAKMLARLGPEAAEPLDEFLSLALLYERGHVPSLEGFLRWVAEGEGQIKRDAEAGARDEVRIMTVHAAKGLEAPIVILPDTLQAPTQTPRLLWSADAQDGFLWPPRRGDEESVCAALRVAADQKRDREYRRLLYVAMTRARDRLYVCGWETKRARSAGSWYELVKSGLEDLAARGKAEEVEFDCAGEIADGWSGVGLRLVARQTAAPESDPRAKPAPAAAGPLPAWVRELAPLEPVPTRPLAPSRPAEDEPAVRSPFAADAGMRFRRGLLVHRLLESLPEIEPSKRAAACRRYLASPSHKLNRAAQAALAAETLAVLEAPGFLSLFGPGSRAEVPLTGNVAGKSGPDSSKHRVSISGQVDRLVATEREVLVIDYKTNRAPPTTPHEVAPLYLRQMAAYRALLRAIYPGKTVNCALLWTDGPRLMALPEALLDRYAP